MAQSVVSDSLFFREIPPEPEKLTPSTMLCRMIEGLGFRFYWATEALRQQDLSWKPNVESRTSEQTIDHIMGLVNIIHKTLSGATINSSGEETSSLSFKVKRAETLRLLHLSAQMLREQNIDLNNAKMVFVRGDSRREYPLWNLLNGPLEDAIWHIGQVVSFRRSSGNPFNAKASVLSGKLLQ